MENYSYELRMKVRDYECDMQGIVNNGVYQNYFEHARHEFLSDTGISFADLNQQGINPVVTRIEIDYKNSLKSGDYFIVKLYMKREGIRFIFYEDLFRESDGVLCAKAKVSSVCTINGRLSKGEELAHLFAKFI